MRKKKRRKMLRKKAKNKRKILLKDLKKNQLKLLLNKIIGKIEKKKIKLKTFYLKYADLK
jgi:hypothetical protein